MKHIYEETYASHFTVMCPAASGYQNKMREQFERVAGYGVDALYIDQMGAGAAFPCFDASHGHSLGGGDNWFRNGYLKYFSGFKAALRQAHPQLAFDSEDMAEPYASLLDGFLPWRSFACNPNATRLPLFPSIYAGRVQFVGKNLEDDETVSYYPKLAEMLVNGEQIAPDNLLYFMRSKPRKAFLKCLAHTRQAMLPYLNDGEMARPLKFKEMPTFEAD